MNLNKYKLDKEEMDVMEDNLFMSDKDIRKVKRLITALHLITDHPLIDSFKYNEGEIIVLMYDNEETGFDRKLPIVIDDKGVYYTTEKDDLSRFALYLDVISEIASVMEHIERIYDEYELDELLSSY